MVNNGGKEQRVKIQQSTVDAVAAENLAAKQVSIANINAGKARVSQAGIGILRAHEVNMERSSAGLIKAKNISAERINTLLCFSDNIKGDVKTVFSRESAILFGIAFGVVISFLRTLRRIIH